MTGVGVTSGVQTLCSHRPMGLPFSAFKRGLCCYSSSPSSSSCPSSSSKGNTALDPFANKKHYKDSPLDLLFINGCRHVYGRLAGWQVQHQASQASAQSLGE